MKGGNSLVISESFAVGCGRETSPAYRTGLRTSFTRGHLPSPPCLAEQRGIPSCSAFSPAPSIELRDGGRLPVEDRQPGFSIQEFRVPRLPVFGSLESGNEKPQVVGNQPGALVMHLRRIAVTAMWRRQYQRVLIGCQGRRAGNERVRHVMTRELSMELGN